MPKASRDLIVRRLSNRAVRGIICLGNQRFPCALGRSGVSSRKREGDGATPRGRFALHYGYIRRDHLRLSGCRLKLIATRPGMGWCDAACDGNYNRPVRHPYRASAERLWRCDHLYDVVVVLGYNLMPRVRGRGSAIFLHLAREGLAPTEGCIAIAARDAQRLFSRLKPGMTVRI